MLDPKGRVVLISGANRGIGRALSECLYRHGYSLSLGGRDIKALSSMVAGWESEKVHLAHYDAMDWLSHAEWVKSAAKRFGRIDVLINNAGMAARGTIRDVSEAALDQAFAVNCKAPLHMIQQALPHLEAGGSGRIVNIASLSGKRVKNDNVAYSMTKFAVVALSHSARRLAWDKGVRVTAVCPSFIATDMTAGAANIARSDMTDPADLAAMVAALIALPNNAAIAELLINCRLEDMV